jgi:tetratricopeptide (TPR) repeat protein
MVSVAARKRKKSPHLAATISNTRSDTTSRPISLYLVLGALLVLVALIFANALVNGFVFDDHLHVLGNRTLRSLQNLPSILLSSYRPLRDVSYAIDFAIWGEKPFGFHLTSLLVHLGNTVLVFFLMRRILDQILPASLAALIFAIHPVQVDSVSYISGRRDILFTVFYLASFLIYLKYRDAIERRRKTRTVVFIGVFLAFWALSLMSKEMAASLPGFIFVWNFCELWDQNSGGWLRRFRDAFRKAFGRDKWFYLAMCLAGPAYVWYQVAIKGASQRARLSGFEYWGGSFYTNLLTSIRVHAWYLKQLVFPTPIVQYSDAFEVSTSIFEWRVILAIIVVGATLAAGIMLLNKERLLAFAILSFFVLLLPVSQIVPHHELLADHYLYLPMMSFGLGVAIVARKFSSRSLIARRAVVATLTVALIVLAVMTVFRNTVYKNDFTLWKTNYEEAPNSLRAVSSLASQYATVYPARSAELYKRCIALNPSYAGAYISLAALYQTKDKAREVEDIVEQGLLLPDSQITFPGYENPNRFRSELTTALAISKGFQGLPREAESLLLKAIDLYPFSQQPYALLISYYRAADREKELGILLREIAIFPDSYDALQSLSFRLIEDKQYEQALPYLQRMLTNAPDDFYANYQTGQIYRTWRDCAKASTFLNAAKRAASNVDDTKTVGDALTGLQQQCGNS